jgi:signal transduction histidine kinase
MDLFVAALSSFEDYTSMLVTQHDDQTPPADETEQRDRLLDIAAHELRTPITSLKGHIQLLQRRLRNQPERESDLMELRKMIYQVERLNHHIDILLAVTHLSQDRFEVFPAAFDLTAEARRIVDLLNAGSSAPPIQLDADEEIVGAWDMRRIRETLLALLTNALKFGQDDGIVLRIRRKDDKVRVEVCDRGRGVPQEERQRIFEPYAIGSNMENAGAGLGLYVARESVKRHHGAIGVKSRPGGGSIFWFELPLTNPAPDAF